MVIPGPVGIVGLGLIGGSLARDLAARGVRVLAADHDARALDAARAEGVVAGALPDAPGADWALELLVLAVPVDAAPAALEAALPRLPPGCVVTDAGSTKQRIGEAARRLGAGARFVGAHPLAGDHRAGWAASRTGLFRDARVYLCPGEAAPDAVARVRRLWGALGAQVEQTDAAAHDRRLAWTSHLPQLLASALALALDERGLPRAELGRGGRDITRLSGSSPELWTAIALDNAPALGEAAEALERNLRRLAEAARAGDARALQRLLETAREWHGASSEEKKESAE